MADQNDHSDPVLAALEQAWAALKNLIDVRDQVNVDLTETSRLLAESRRVTRGLDHGNHHPS